MKRFFIIICLFNVFCVIPSFAGTDTEERRTCLMKAISLLDDYEYYSVMNDEDTRNGFRGLFASDSTKVFNDLLGFSDTNAISVREYINLLSTNAKIPTIKLKNISKESVRKEGNVWKVVCTFKKEMSYTDNCGILLSSKEFYKEDYTIKVHMTYNPSTDKCVIDLIDGNSLGKRLSPNYCAIQSSNENTKYDQEIRYNNNNLIFNSYYQAILSEPFDVKKLKYRDPDVVVSPKIDQNCPKLITLNYKSLRLRAKLHYDLGLGNAYKVDAPSVVSNSSSANNIGVDFGYIFPSKSMVKTGIFIGLGISSSKIDLGYVNSDYSYAVSETDASKSEIDGETYTRHYHDMSLTQTLKLTDLTIPVYFDVDFKLGKAVSIFADLGVRANLNMSAKADDISGTANVYGVYPQYGNLVIDGSTEFSRYNGFGDVSFSSANLKDSKIPDVNSFTADGLLGVGLRYNIPTMPLVIEVGAQYTMGFMDVVKKNSNPAIVSGSPTYSNAIAYNEISGSQSKEYLRSLSETVNSIKRQALRLSLGVTYKF